MGFKMETVLIDFVTYPVVKGTNRQRSGKGAISKRFPLQKPDLLLKKLKGVPLFIRLLTRNGAIWSIDQRTVIMR